MTTEQAALLAMAEESLRAARLLKHSGVIAAFGMPTELHRFLIWSRIGRK